LEAVAEGTIRRRAALYCVFGRSKAGFAAIIGHVGAVHGAQRNTHQDFELLRRETSNVLAVQILNSVIRGLVVLWCRMSVCSPWVAEEAGLASTRRILVPVKIEPWSAAGDHNVIAHNQVAHNQTIGILLTDICSWLHNVAKVVIPPDLPLCAKCNRTREGECQAAQGARRGAPQPGHDT
jgi:hypothetical protein